MIRYSSRMFFDAMTASFCRGRSPLRPETGITLILRDAEDCVPYKDSLQGLNCNEQSRPRVLALAIIELTAVLQWYKIVAIGSIFILYL